MQVQLTVNDISFFLTTPRRLQHLTIVNSATIIMMFSCPCPVPPETPVAVHPLGGRAGSQSTSNWNFLRSLHMDFHRDHTNWHPYLQSLRAPLERNLCLWKFRSARLPLINLHPTRFRKQGWNDGTRIQVTTAALREFLGVLSEFLDNHRRGEVT